MARLATLRAPSAALDAARPTVARVAHDASRLASYSTRWTRAAAEARGEERDPLGERWLRRERRDEKSFVSAVDFEARAVKNEEIRRQDAGGIGG